MLKALAWMQPNGPQKNQPRLPGRFLALVAGMPSTRPCAALKLWEAGVFWRVLGVSHVLQAPTGLKTKSGSTCKAAGAVAGHRGASKVVLVCRRWAVFNQPGCGIPTPAGQPALNSGLAACAELWECLLGALRAGRGGSGA